MRVYKRTDRSRPVRILMVHNWGCGRGRVGSVDYRAKSDQMGMAGVWPPPGPEYWGGCKHPPPRQGKGAPSAIFPVGRRPATTWKKPGEVWVSMEMTVDHRG